MMKIFANLFGGKAEGNVSVYEGLSDFFLRAPVDEKKKIIEKAAHKANEDQSKVFNEARLKAEAN